MMSEAENRRCRSIDLVVNFLRKFLTNRLSGTIVVRIEDGKVAEIEETTTVTPDI